ncbi:hypothetical protein BVX98_01410 [bacterium F11]|nr:hypothetical protein BVX98_01410 [bacterium F11]
MNQKYFQSAILSVFFILGIFQMGKTADQFRTTVINSPAIVTTDIENDRVRVQLQFDVEGLSPKVTTEDLTPILSDSVGFLTDRVDRLSPTFTKIELRDHPTKKIFYSEMIFPFKEKPKELSVIARFARGRNAKVPVGFRVSHQSKTILPFGYVSSSGKLKLDWENPKNSICESRPVRHEPEAPFRTFLYVEQNEVRHEILVRTRAISDWVDFGLQGKKYIEVDDWDQIKGRLSDFLLKKNKLRVDGKEKNPILDWIDFIHVTPTDISIVEGPERLDQNDAMIGVVLAYVTDGIPNEVAVEWDLFNEEIKTVQATLQDSVGYFSYSLTPEDNVIHWRDHYNQVVPEEITEVELRKSWPAWFWPAVILFSLAFLVPLGIKIRSHQKKRHPTRGHWLAVGGIILIAVILGFLFANPIKTPFLRSVESERILQSLLKNVYRSFDFRKEEDVYDKLSMSVSGDLLTTIYLQNRKSFTEKIAGGSHAKVKSVTILAADVMERRKKEQVFTIRSKWTAMGDVGHWGHVHKRKNLYEALIDIMSIEGKWKMTGLTLLEETRIDPDSTDIVPLKKTPTPPMSKNL